MHVSLPCKKVLLFFSEQSTSGVNFFSFFLHKILIRYHPELYGDRELALHEEDGEYGGYK
jgi:hypothetical protein